MSPSEVRHRLKQVDERLRDIESGEFDPQLDEEHSALVRERAALVALGSDEEGAHRSMVFDLLAAQQSGAPTTDGLGRTLTNRPVRTRPVGARKPW